MTYSISNGILRVEVETLGAQLKSVYSLKTNVEYLWQGDEKIWSGRAYNIFPYVGRNYNGEYIFKNKKYPLRIHGLARYYEFTLVDKSENSLTFLFSSNDETKKQYPFDFEFYVIYTICANQLKCDYRVKNCGEDKMFFALGGHPGFNVPFDKGAFEDYCVQFEKNYANLHLLSDSMFISGKVEKYNFDDNRIKLAHSLFDRDALIFSNAGSTVKIASYKTNNYLEFGFADYKYLALWQMPNTDAQYVCLEPWSALPAFDGKMDELDKKPDVLSLEGGDETTKSFSVKICEQ